MFSAIVFLFLLVLAFLVFVATRREKFRIARSITIAATAEAIFPFINDLRQHAQWGPWETLDPTMKREYSDNPVGVGAWYGWRGDKSVGEGRMTVSESQPAARVLMRLEFIKPFKAKNSVEFLLVPQNDGTEVTWAMSGKNNFLGKLMSLVCSEKMIGDMFEKGLANLKTLTEK